MPQNSFSFRLNDADKIKIGESTFAISGKEPLPSLLNIQPCKFASPEEIPAATYIQSPNCIRLILPNDDFQSARIELEELLKVVGRRELEICISVGNEVYECGTGRITTGFGRWFYNYEFPGEIGRPFLAIKLDKFVPESLFLLSTHGRAWVATRYHEIGEYFFANNQEIIDELKSGSISMDYCLEYDHYDGRFLCIAKDGQACAIAAKLKGRSYESRNGRPRLDSSYVEMGSLGVFPNAIISFDLGIELVDRFIGSSWNLVAGCKKTMDSLSFWDERINNRSL